MTYLAFELKILHFDNEYDIHMSSEKYEANANRHNLELLIISY